MLRKGLPLLICVSIYLLFSQAIALAAGKMVLEPRITAAYQYEKNFWRAELDAREAPVSTYLVQPGVTFGYKTAKSQIYLSYDLDAYWYDDIDDVQPGNRKASEDNYVGHALNLAAGTRQMNERLLIGVKEDFYLTRDQGYSDALSDSFDRGKYFINRIEPMVFYDFSRTFTAGLRYRNTQTNYIDGDREDSSENRGLADVVYNISRTSSLNLDYQLWRRTYNKDSSDYTSNQILLNYRKQYKKFSYYLGAGYHGRSFNQSDLGSENIIPWRVGVRFASEPVQISPLYPDLSEPKSWVSLSAEHNLNDQGLGNRYFDAYRVSLNAGHIFWERIKVGFNGYYQRSNYLFTTGPTSPPNSHLEKRLDDSFYFDLEIGYMFTRWLTLAVNPGIEKRNSNLVGRSFSNPLIMINLTFNYNVGRDKSEEIE